MQTELLDLLRCPVSKNKLEIISISMFIKTYDSGPVEEVKEGLLISPEGFMFPVIDGIPRMLVEAVYDYADFLESNMKDYQQAREKLEEKHALLLEQCRKKNERTKKSFAFEWKFLDPEKNDSLWHQDISSLERVIEHETGKNISYFKDKKVIDIGSAHGLMSRALGKTGAEVVGVELSRAVEVAYQKNKSTRLHFLQGDLQFLPFSEETFDYLYSSGVIHHTNNTELSLSLISRVLKNTGEICLWLYHPQKSVGHALISSARKILCRLPVKISFLIIAVFIFPMTYTVKKIKNKKPLNFREELVDLLDALTPPFRHETTEDTAKTWLTGLGFNDTRITTENLYGFSITGTRKPE